MLKDLPGCMISDRRCRGEEEEEEDGGPCLCFSVNEPKELAARRKPPELLGGNLQNLFNMAPL